MDQNQNALDSIFDSPRAEAAPSSPGSNQFWSQLAGKLRGRYLLLGTLMLITGSIGAVGGWKHGKRSYRGEGIILFSNDMPNVAGALRAPMADPDRFIDTEATLLTDGPVIESAISSKVWQALGPPESLASIGSFAARVSMDHSDAGGILHIYFSDPNPKVAGAGVLAVVHAYEADFDERQVNLQSNDMAALIHNRTDLIAELNSYNDQLQKIVTKYGTDNLEAVQNTKMQVWQEYAKRASELEEALVMVGSDLPPSERIASLTPLDISMVDPRMAQLIDVMEEAEKQVQKCVDGGLGPNNFALIDARDQLTAAQKHVNEYAENFRNVQRNMLGNPQLDGGLGGTPNAIQSLLQNEGAVRAKQKQFERMAAQAKTEWMELGAAKFDAEKIKEQCVGIPGQITQIDTQINSVALQDQIQRSLRVITYGSNPAPFYKDNRPAWCMLGAIAGMFIPFIGMGTIALRDKRYRYSDETNKTEQGLPPLLGILPLIPVQMPDPEQAAVVAHSIHQIRVTLQIGHGTSKPATYMVTSGSAGDGKTSLTVALGMSFASSGARTLLIDGDMVGQALSRRLAEATKPGAASPMLTGSLNSSVQQTAIPNLSVLPLPNDAANNPSALSPHTVRTLLNQARSRFDVILVDTGPVMGSIEASVISSAVDGVILAVSRGRDRSVVSNAIHHLRSTNARVLGMVFNRAEGRDFRKSVASNAVRSIPAVPMPTRELPEYEGDVARFGPLAAYVTSMTRPDGITLPDEDPQ